MEIQKRDVSQSVAYWNRCRKVIPAGSCTLAKSPSRLSYGSSPFYAKSAAGSHFQDVDGNDWLDCEMSMGTVVWGHCRKEVDEALIAQIRKGMHYSVPSTLEYELAERLLSRFPKFHAAKFFTNGADAVYACVRAARFLSRRNQTLSCEYHGWLDWAAPTYYRCAPEELGIPKEALASHISVYGGATEVLEQIERAGERMAAVVLCPANYEKEQLEQILDACRRYGIYSIFDEVTSGYRFAKGGVTTAYGLSPSYLCLSKGLTNGLPLAVALGGTEDILTMERLKISNAHAGGHLSLAAALACENLLDRQTEWPSWRKQTEHLMDKLSTLLPELPDTKGLQLSGSAGCFSLNTPGADFLDDPFRHFMMKYLAERGIFSKGYILFSDAHTEEEISFVGSCLYDCVQKYASNS